MWAVPRPPITNGITVTLMLHSFLRTLARSKYVFLLSFSLIFTLWSAGAAKSTIRQILSGFVFVFLFFFLLLFCFVFCFYQLSLNLVFQPGLDNLFVSQNPREFWASNSPGQTDSVLGMYHSVLWTNFNFFHNSQWIIFPTQLCRSLYSFCASLLYCLVLYSFTPAYGGALSLESEWQ